MVCSIPSQEAGNGVNPPINEIDKSLLPGPALLYFKGIDRLSSSGHPQKGWQNASKGGE